MVLATSPGGCTMIRLSKESRLKPDQIITKADRFFGETGEGLVPKDRSLCCIHFTGSGGFVSVSVVEDRKKRTVEVETREFDFQAKRFLEGL